MNMHLLLLYFLPLMKQKNTFETSKQTSGLHFFIGNFPKNCPQKNATNHLKHPQNPNPPFRKELFTLKLDTAYLRNERIMERKLRPWLERKIATWHAHFLLVGREPYEQKLSLGGAGLWVKYALVSFIRNLNMSPQVDFFGCFKVF